MNPHPTAEQLERLLDESLSDTDRQGIERHVNQCADCQLALARLTDSAPGLDQQLHATPAPAAEGLRFLDRLKNTPPLTDRGSGTLREGHAPSLENLAEWQEALQRDQEFRILEKLGHGGFGVVFKAYDAKLDQQVAIKVLHPDLAEQEMQRARFEREARKAAAVRHDHVVTVYRLGQQSGLPFIVMEFIQGEPLSARLKRDGKLPPREAAEIVRQVAQGLAAAHAQNVVHRDIKPSNVLLDQKTGRAKIADFGIAREIEGAGPKVTSTNERPGTLEYMSPEHLRGAAQLDGRSDLYSLGVVLYELLTGELPFHGQTHLVIQQVLQQEPKPPRRLNDRVPADLETITLRCLAKEPGRRYQSAQELAEDLQRFLAGEPIQARRVTFLERRLRWFRRRPAAAALLGTSIVAAAALALVVYVLDSRSRLAGLNDELQTANTNLAKAKDDVDQFNNNLKGTNLALAAARKDAEESADKAKGKAAEAIKAKADAEKANQDLAIANKLLEKKKAESLKNLYVAQINLAQQAWEEGNVKQAAYIIQDLAKRETDLRGFEWYYLNHLLHHGKDGFRGKDSLNLEKGVACLAVYPGGEGNGQLKDAILAVASAGVEQPTVKFRRLTGSGDWKFLPMPPFYITNANAIRYTKMAFSPDGKYLAAVAARADLNGKKHVITGKGMLEETDTAVVLWKTDSLPPKYLGLVKPKADPFSKSSNAVASITFTPNSTHLISGHVNGKVQIWELPSRQAVGKLLAHPWPVRKVAISPDGSRLVCAVGNYAPDRPSQFTLPTDSKAPAAGSVYVWDDFLTNPGQPYILPGHKDMVTAVAISPDGRKIASASYDHTVHIWEGDKGRRPVLRHVLPHSREVEAVAFNQPDGKFLASAGWDMLVHIWDSSTGQPFHTFAGHEGVVQDLAFLPRTEPTVAPHVLSQDTVGALKHWSLQTDPRFFLLGEDKEDKVAILSAAFAQDSRHLFTLDKNRKLQSWDIKSQKLLKSALPPGHETWGNALSPKADFLILVGNSQAQVRTLDEALGPAKSLAKVPQQVDRIAFSGNGKRVALAGSDCIAVYDLGLAGTNPVLQLAISQVSVLALTEDGQYLAFVTGQKHFEPPDSKGGEKKGNKPPSAKAQGKLWIWSLDGKSVPQELGTVSTQVNQLAFSPDGQWLAAANQDFTVSVWNVPARSLSTIFKGHLCHVNSVAFSPDGKRLASSSEDWTIRIWDLETGLTTLTLKGHQGRVLTVAFDDAGQQLVSTSEDGTARVWAAPRK